MSAPESAEAPSTRAGPGRWTTVLRSHVGYIPGRSRCVRGVCFKRNETKRTEHIAFEMCGGRPALHKGDMFSSITFDPGICQIQDKYQLQKFKESLKMSQGRAFGAFTFLLDIDFPKANLQGNV